MDERGMQHGLDWSPDVDLAGWYASEKFNGCRAYWDGSVMWSRGGIAIKIPDAWRAALPAGVALDGEVYDGQDGLARCSAAVRLGKFTPSMRYMVYDNPGAGHGEKWPMRMAEVAHVLALYSEIVSPVYFWRLANTEEAFAALDAVLTRGGEGLMVRHPDMAYRPGRTSKLLKLNDWIRRQYPAGSRCAKANALIATCFPPPPERRHHGSK